MGLLVTGLVLFLGTHIFTLFTDVRARLVGRFGEGAYKGVYSLVAGIGLVLVVYGFGRYRAEQWIDVWYPPLWTRHLALLLMLPAFISLVATYCPGRIKRALKHPMLLAVKIWATTHLLVNGDLGSILLFGSMLAWAVVARIVLKRQAAANGDPVTAAASPQDQRNDIFAIAIGTVAWFVFARWLHPILIGVSVWPGK